jgi:4-hydroxybenzoate polyprenyltransferase
MRLSALKWQNIAAYKQLMRTDKPIGTFLLLWPTYWALWIANQGMPSWHLLLVFSLGVFVMRSAGCVINDYADRHIDGAVKRTSNRPLALGAASEGEAISLFLLLIISAFCLVLTLNWQTIILSLGALLLAACYPFMKRFTHLPQVVLGAAFSWSIPMAFMASTSTVPSVAWWLFFANLIWTVAYDTMYAMVDRDDDLKLGVKSTAILFGDKDRVIIATLNTTFIFIMTAVFIHYASSLNTLFGIAAAVSLLIYQQKLIHHRERDKCFSAFLNNHYVGLVLFLGLIISF